MARAVRLSWHGFTWRLWLSLVLVAGGIFLFTQAGAPVVLRWETASEVNTAGFNVYRAPYGTASDADFTQINTALIAAQGDEVAGAAYSYADQTAKPAQRYQYRIEEVEWDGQSMLYPETVQVRAGLSAGWVRFEGGILLILAFVSFWRYLREY